MTNNGLPNNTIMDRDLLKTPFPWFGGKSRAADLVWARLGDVSNYIEPFFGSGAVLFRRPHWPFDDGRIHTETVNDLDGCVTNAWRAIQRDPEQTAIYSDNPIHELDLHARHLWLHRRLKQVDGLDPDAIAYSSDKGVLPFAAWLTIHPEAYDCRVAGWWIWGLCSWIGDNWCRPSPNHSRPDLGNAGMGVNRRHRESLVMWFSQLAERLRHVDVCCGDWERVCGGTPTEKRASPCGVFLDPPYSQDAGLDTVYGDLHDRHLSSRVREWAIERGGSKDMRIALCGYEGEHSMPDDWECVRWKANGGYGSQSKSGNANRHRERIWFSPHCLKIEEDHGSLFAMDRNGL